MLTDHFIVASSAAHGMGSEALFPHGTQKDSLP